MYVLGVVTIFLIWIFLTYKLGLSWKSKGKSLIDLWIMSWFISPFMIGLPISLLWRYIFDCETNNLSSICSRGGMFASKNLDLMLLFSTWGFWVTGISAFWLYVILSIFKRPNNKAYSEESK